MLANAPDIAQERPIRQDGDAAFYGVLMRADAGSVPQGLLSDARNVRCRRGVAGTRKGVVKPAWCNRTEADTNNVVEPFGTIHGAGVFRDPSSVEWTLIAADGGVWFSRPGNPMTALGLPSGVSVPGKASFVQAFNQVYLFRGRNLAPLVLSDLGTGFEDVVSHWDSATAYAPAQNSTVAEEVAYGPFQAVSSATCSGTVVTVVTAQAHGYVSGADITVTGASVSGYNGRWSITVVDDSTFTYRVPSALAATTTGTITVSNMAWYYRAQGSVLGAYFSNSSKTITVHGALAGIQEGDSVTLSGATGADAGYYNGTYTVSNVTANSFDYLSTGAPANAPVGTVLISGMTLPTITKSSTTATVSYAAHGFSNGDRIQVQGATDALYNGTFTVTNAATDTFDYVMSGTPSANASGAIRIVNASRVVAGQNPDSHPEAWTRLYTVLPNADTACYLQNLMVVPTAYDPDTGAYAAKVDYCIAMNYLDPVHFTFVNNFRINQGGDDEIVDVAKFNDSTAVVFKSKSVWQLSALTLDLSQVSLSNIIPDYGLAAVRAWTVVGNNIYFLATSRGVVSIQQTQLNKLQGVDLPLSDDIQALIDQINWADIAGARVAWWDSKLYAAVPLGNGRIIGKNLVPSTASFPEGHGAIPGDYTLSGLTIGRQYVFTPGSLNVPGVADFGYETAMQGTTNISGTFVSQDTTLTITGLNNLPVKSTVQRVLSHVNNAILVYDFVNGKWQGRDDGEAICPAEFFLAFLNGRQRLFFAGADGYVNVMEETFADDQVQSLTPTVDTGLSRTAIVTYALTRGYSFAATGAALDHKRGRKLAVILATWHPNYSAALVYGDAVDVKTKVSDVTKSPVKYAQPWDATDWDATNVNLDHATPKREDYSVSISSAGVMFMGGVQLDVMQEARETFKLTGNPSRYTQVQIMNTQGRIELRGVEYQAQTTDRRKGSHV